MDRFYLIQKARYLLPSLLLLIFSPALIKGQNTKELTEIRFQDPTLYQYYLNPAMPGQYAGLEIFAATQFHGRSAWMPVHTHLLGGYANIMPGRDVNREAYINLGGTLYHDREGPHIRNTKFKLGASYHFEIGSDEVFISAGVAGSGLYFSMDDPYWLGQQIFSWGGVDAGMTVYRQAGKNDVKSGKIGGTSDLWAFGLSFSKLWQSDNNIVTSEADIRYNTTIQGFANGVLGYEWGKEFLIKYHSTVRFEAGAGLDSRVGAYFWHKNTNLTAGALCSISSQHGFGNIGLSVGYDPIFRSDYRTKFLFTFNTVVGSPNSRNPMPFELSIRHTGGIGEKSIISGVNKSTK